MSINLETLIRQTVPTWTYGTTISGPTLSTILNTYQGQIAITGVVTSVGSITLDNPYIDIVGNGTLSAEGKASWDPDRNIEVKRFYSIDGIKLYANKIRFPDDSTATGIIQNIPETDAILFFSSSDSPVLYYRPAVELYGLRLENITWKTGMQGLYTISGGGSGIVFSNLKRCGIMNMGGYDNTFEGCDFDGGASGIICFKFASHFSYKSSANNVVRGCTFSGGREEMIGWDNFTTTAMHCSVAERGADYVVLTPIATPVYGPQTSLTGSNSVGRHVLVLNGASRGNYFSIYAQQDNKLYLHSDKFTLSTLAVGDWVNVGVFFADNIFEDCIIHNNSAVVTNPAVGIGNRNVFSFFWNCIGNTVQRNKIYQYHKDSAVFGDSSMHTSESFFEANPAPNTAWAYNLNARNRYLDNKIFWLDGVALGRQDMRWDLVDPTDGMGPGAGKGSWISTVGPQPDYTSNTEPFAWDDQQEHWATPMIAKSCPYISWEMTALTSYANESYDGTNCWERKPNTGEPLNIGLVYTGNQSYIGPDESMPVAVPSDIHAVLDVTWEGNSIPKEQVLTQYDTGNWSVWNWVHSQEPPNNFTGPSIVNFIASVPKVARKLRSPSGGKIRGKGAGKVSGKPQ